MEGGKVVGDCAVTVNGRRQPWGKHGEVGAIQARQGQCQKHTLQWLCMLAWCCAHATLPCCLNPAQHHCAALVQVLIRFFMLPADFKHERAFFNGFVHGSFVPGMPASLHNFPWRLLMHCGLAASPMTTDTCRLHVLPELEPQLQHPPCCLCRCV